MKNTLALFFCTMLSFQNVYAQLGSSIADSIMANSLNLPYLSSDTTFLPDGNGITYYDTISQFSFLPEQVIENGSDIFSVCMNIEHSYLGDLTISLTCPNGQSVLLADPHNSSSYNSVFLGEALDDGGLDPGIGWNYCFSDNAMKGTFSEESLANNLDSSALDSFKLILRSDLYALKDSIDPLIGCPVNGDWIIGISDNILSDNGYIFNWQINFDTLLFPENYNMGSARVEVTGGVPPYHYFWSNGDIDSVASRLAPGIYTVQVTDSDTVGGKMPNKTFSEVVITADGLTAVESVSLDLVNLYPNPVKESLFVNGKGVTKVEILAISGVLLKSKSFSQRVENSINVSDLPAGIYFVKLFIDNEAVVHKFLKE